MFVLLVCRHIILSAAPILTVNQWEVVCLALHRACSLSLFSLHQLMAGFRQGSHSCYGDGAHVKVAARRDSTPEESQRLKQLAQQVYIKQESVNQLDIRNIDFLNINTHSFGTKMCS